jgi:hypothetical protein
MRQTIMPSPQGVSTRRACASSAATRSAGDCCCGSIVFSTETLLSHTLRQRYAGRSPLMERSRAAVK